MCKNVFTNNVFNQPYCKFKIQYLNSRNTKVRKQFKMKWNVKKSLKILCNKFNEA